MEIVIILLMISLISTSIFVSWTLYFDKKNVKKDISKFQIHFELDLQKREFYFYNIENSNSVVKHFIERDNAFVEEIEEFLDPSSVKKLEAFIQEHNTNKKIQKDFPTEMTLRAKINNSIYNIRIVFIYRKENKVHGHLFLSIKGNLRTDEVTLAKDILSERPKIAEKDYLTYFVNKTKDESKIDIILVNYDDFLKTNSNKWLEYLIVQDINRKIIKWYKQSNEFIAYWILDDLSIIFMVREKSELKGSKMIIRMETLIKKTFNRFKMKNQSGIHISYLTSQQINSKLQLEEIIEKLFFITNLAHEKNITSMTLSEPEIMEETVEIEVNKKIVSELLDNKINDENIFTIFDTKTKEPIIKSYYQNVNFGKSTLHRKDIMNVEELHNQIIKNIAVWQKKDTKMIIGTNFSLNYFYYMTDNQILELFKGVKKKLYINFVYDNTVIYNLTNLQKKITLLRKISSENKNIKIKIGISKMMLQEKNVPFLIKIKPDFVLIDWSVIEDLNIRLDKQNILKQYKTIFDTYGGGFIIKNPKNIEELNKWSDYDFDFIEDQKSTWKEIFNLEK